MQETSEAKTIRLGTDLWMMADLRAERLGKEQNVVRTALGDLGIFSTSFIRDRGRRGLEITEILYTTKGRA